MNTIVTWMYASPRGEKIAHAQMRKSVDDQKMQDHYWRCLFMLFESSCRLNSDTRHILFINVPPPEFVDGIELGKLIEQLQIEVIYFPSITKSPSDYYKAWNTQFIVLDVLEWLAQNVSNHDNVFILDSDIIFNKAISQEMSNDIKAHKALLYTIDYGPEHSINGLTKGDLLKISKDMQRAYPTDGFAYSGGEFICCLGSEIANIAELGRSAYEESLIRHKEGKPKFFEEAHLLSYVYALLGYKTHGGNKYIKRMWTDRSVSSNLDGTEDGLTLWHLPAEKRDGFRTLFRSLRKTNARYHLSRNDFDIIFHIRENTHTRLLRMIKQCIRPFYNLLKKLK
jgi:hypothetical protein